MYLALDPGKTTGWALFDTYGQLLSLGSIKIDELPTMLRAGWGSTKICIAEKFRAFPGMERKMMMSSFPAAEALGMIKLACEIRGWELHLQEPQGMRQWAAQLGYKYGNKTHIPDKVSAHAHGAHYLIKAGQLTLMDAQADKGRYETKHKTA